MTGKLFWLGTEVLERVIAAADGAIDDTLEQAVNVAKSETPVQSGAAQASIRHEGGEWGSFEGVPYFIYLETGTNDTPKFAPLRKGADAAYPSLAERIRAKLL